MTRCEECSTEFEPRGRAKFCSPACRSRAYVKRHPDRRAASIKTAWERLRRDPIRYERFLAHGRASYARHPLTGYLYAVAWRGANREKVRARNNRRHRQQSPLAAIREYAAILRGDPCTYCGEPMEVIDHIDPLALGGLHEPENLTAACRSCNARKRSTPLLHFLLARA